MIGTMIGTAKISLYCPQMPITHIKGRLYRTAIEDMTATITLPDAAVLVIPKVEIPATDVHEHLFQFPNVATVDACTGAGAIPEADLVVNLPLEPVVFETWSLVAKAIIAPVTLTLRLPTGTVTGQGAVMFPDCPTKLFGGGAAAVTALGSVMFP